MPKAKVQGIDIYYEVHGSGYPLILIRGLGSNADHWYCQLPAFTPHFSVVVFDNRGIARSEAPDLPFTVATMADDTVFLMDTIGIDKAHVLGISMGGMIVQEMALRHGDRVNGLILACTNCGGAHAVQPASDVLKDLSEFLFTRSQEAAPKATRALFSDNTIQQKPEVIQRYGEVSAKYPPPSQTLMHQIKSIQEHDAWERLPGISNPAMVITGSDDRLIPPENSRILSGRIPDSQLRVIEKVGHQLFIEEPDQCNSAVLDFLRPLSK